MNVLAAYIGLQATSSSIITGWLTALYICTGSSTNVRGSILFEGVWVNRLAPNFTQLYASLEHTTVPNFVLLTLCT